MRLFCPNFFGGERGTPLSSANSSLVFFVDRKPPKGIIFAKAQRILDVVNNK